MRIFPSLVLALSFAAQSPALPLTFEQRDAQRFLARLPDSAIEVRPDRLTLGDVTLRFSGAFPNARVEGLGAPAPSTYLRAGFSRTFRQFPKIAIRNLYPGIDAVFYGNGEDLEYDLNVAPGVSPSRIRISLDGARHLTIDSAGNLAIETASGTLHQMRPRVSQSNREIPARYVLLRTNQIGIRLGKYNRRLPLTIDPVLAYVKYFGKSGRAIAIAVDPQGNIYVAGQSNSPDFPVTPNGFEPKLAPPLIVLSNAGQTVSSISVAGAIRVQLVGGTADGTILYAATPDGIFLSGDSGATWRPPTRPPSSLDASSPQPLTVNSISVDPLDPATLLIATNDGLFGSNSGGLQWGGHNTGLPVNGGNRVSVSSAFYHPANPLVAYAVTANPSSIAASSDAGNTWRVLNPTYPGEPAPPQPIYTRMAAALSTDGAVLYAINGNGALLKSADGGSSWAKLTQGFFGPIAITPDPSNPAALYVLDQISLQKSTDGGLTFTKIAAPFSVRSFTVDSAGVLYIADFNQVRVSTDGGATFTSAPAAEAFEITSVTSLGGNVYAGSSTMATPFITKLDPTGSNILYSTFLGGSNGDFPTSLAVDAAGNAVLGGTASSPDFPLTVPASSPPSRSKPAAFVAKLSPDGTHLIYSTVLGSSRYSTVQAVAVDASGGAFVTGQTSPGFPVAPGALQPGIPPAPCNRNSNSPFVITDTGQHAFVTRISPDGGSLLYSTYLTGSCGSSGLGITVDPAGNAVVVGNTTSQDFPVSQDSYQPAFPGAADKPSPPNTLSAGFVTRLSPAGDQILASSYLGGGYSTTARAVTLDASGNAYITGFTQGMLHGATPGAYQTTLVDHPSPPYTGTGDAFVLKLDPALASASFLTYLGGACNDFGSSVALDPAGNIWVGGSTGSPDFPVKDPFQMGGIPTSSFAGFVSELSPDASQLLFSSFSESAALAMSPSGVYLAGASGNSALVARVDPLATPPVHIDAVRPMIAFPPATVFPSSFNIAPGLLIQITGRNLGPAAKVSAQLDSTGRLPFILGNTSVFFDRVPAALVSLEATSIVCFVPFEVGPVSQITVVSGGQRSNAVRTAVATSAPQILSIVNEDGVANSPDHPARVGSVIALFVSGLGQTNPPGADGLVNAQYTQALLSASPLPVPLTPVNVFLSQRRVDTQSVQAAPGLIAGITQVNVQIPPSAVPSPSQQGIALSLNSANATLYVAQ